MKIKIALLFIVIISTKFVLAQSDFQSGFIVNNSGDTIKGFVDWKKNTINSRYCKFKKVENSDLVTYLPTEIQSYGITNQKLYVSKIVNLDDKQDTLFLEYLVNGIVNLYYLKKPANDLYFIEKDDVLVELSNDEISYIDQTGVEYSKNSNNYQGVLLFLMNDTPDLTNKISQTTFDHKSLINTTVNYHNMVCDDYSCVDYTKQLNSSFFIEPHIGAIYSKLVIDDMEGASIDFRPIFGVKFNYRPGLLKDSWKMVVGVNYYKSYYDSSFIEKNLNGISIDRNYIIEYHALNIPIYIEYNILKKDQGPYVAFGMNSLFAIQSEGDIRRTTRSGVFEEPFDFRTFNIGILAGVGYNVELSNKNYINCFVSYDFCTPLIKTGYILDYHYVHSLQLNLGYAFKIK